MTVRSSGGGGVAAGPAAQPAQVTTLLHRSGPSSSAYFHNSPNPARRSRSGSVISASSGQATRLGCQNAPTRFLPAGRSTAVLPPIAESVIATIVVGTWTTG